MANSPKNMCFLCGQEHKEEELTECWENDCQNSTDTGTYCKDGICFELHYKHYHPDVDLMNDTRKAKVRRKR